MEALRFLLDTSIRLELNSNEEFFNVRDNCIMQIFISHAEPDKGFARRLAEDLRASGLNVWIAPESILPGEDWVSAIDRGLTTSSHMLIVLTPSAVSSRWVQSEVNTAIRLAHEEKIEIIPLEVTSADPPALWRSYQMIAGFGDDYIAGLERLARRFGLELQSLATLEEFNFTQLVEPYRTQFNNILGDIRKQLLERLRDKELVEAGYLIASTILMEGLRAIARRTHPKRLAGNLLHITSIVSTYFDEKSIPLEKPEDITQLIKVSTGSTVISALIKEATDKIGKDGAIVTESGRRELELHIVEGLQFDRSYISPEFVTDHDTLEIIIRDSYIFITDKRILLARDIAPVVDKLIQSGKPNLLVIAQDVEDEALNALLQHRNNNSMNVIVVKPPGFGDKRSAILQDIAIITGGTVITDKLLNLATVTVNDLGQADKVITTEDNTTIIGAKGKTSMIEARVREIRKLIDETDSDYDREKYIERLANIVRGIAIIRVGGRSEAERNRNLSAVNQALKVYRAVINSGFLPGGDLAFVNAAESLRDSNSGEDQEAVNIMAIALEMPIRRLAEGMGRDGDETLKAIRFEQKKKKSSNIGYFSEADEFRDLVKAGVIIPLQFAKSLIQTSVEVTAQKLSEFRYTDEIVRRIK